MDPWKAYVSLSLFLHVVHWVHLQSRVMVMALSGEPEQIAVVTASAVTTNTMSLSGGHRLETMDLKSYAPLTRPRGTA